MVFNQIGERFRRAVGDFADRERITVVRFAKSDRKADVMGPYLRRAAATGRSQVAAIGVAQEFQRVFTGYDRAANRPVPPHFAFDKAERRVSCFYCICGTPTSARHSSRYAPTSHIPLKYAC